MRGSGYAATLSTQQLLCCGREWRRDNPSIMVGSDRVTTLMLFKILFLCLQHFLKVILKQCVSIHDKGKFARKKCLNIMCPLTCDVFHVYIYMAAEWEGNWGK